MDWNVTLSAKCDTLAEMKDDFSQELECVARVLGSQVDPSTCGSVRKYLDSSSSPIRDVIMVGEELSLPWAAALFCEWSNETAESIEWKKVKLLSLFEAGQLLGSTWPQAGEMVFRWQDIPDDWLCRVIYLPPYYVIQLKHESEGNTFCNETK